MGLMKLAKEIQDATKLASEIETCGLRVGEVTQSVVNLVKEYKVVRDKITDPEDIAVIDAQLAYAISSKKEYLDGSMTEDERKIFDTFICGLGFVKA